MPFGNDSLQHRLAATTERLVPTLRPLPQPASNNGLFAPIDGESSQESREQEESHSQKEHEKKEPAQERTEEDDLTLLQILEETEKKDPAAHDRVLQSVCSQLHAHADDLIHYLQHEALLPTNATIDTVKPEWMA